MMDWTVFRLGEAQLRFYSSMPAHTLYTLHGEESGRVVLDKVNVRTGSTEESVEMRTLFGMSLDAMCVSQNRVFAVNGADDSITVCRLDGSWITTFGTRGRAPGQFCNIGSVCCVDESLYVCETGNARVQICTFDGAPAGLFPTEDACPLQVEVTQEEIFVRHSCFIAIYDSRNGWHLRYILFCQDMSSITVADYVYCNGVAVIARRPDGNWTHGWGSHETRGMRRGPCVLVGTKLVLLACSLEDTWLFVAPLLVRAELLVPRGTSFSSVHIAD